jgi:hypothetical protein
MFAFGWYNKDIIATEGSEFDGVGDLKSLSKQKKKRYLIVQLFPQ